MSNFRCPITYQPIGSTLTDAHARYSPEGLRLLSRNLKNLSPLPFSPAELREEARSRADKMSVQGVQPKLSAVLNSQKGCFDIVDIHGKYILKPPLPDFNEVPANEDLTMRMAAEIGIEVPLHGLLYNSDGSFTYFIKRFDRMGRNRKIPTEDFAQLSSNTRETKYNFSMEKIVPIIDQYCTFPFLCKKDLFTRVLFNYLVGNEDMHLKNFSLITREGKTELAPAYDFLNTSILLTNVKEELALSLNGKKSKLLLRDFVDYYAYQRLSLNENTVNEIFNRIQTKIPQFFNLIAISFLSEPMKKAYENLLSTRIDKTF